MLIRSFIVSPLLAATTFRARSIVFVNFCHHKNAIHCTQGMSTAAAAAMAYGNDESQPQPSSRLAGRPSKAAQVVVPQPEGKKVAKKKQIDTSGATTAADNSSSISRRKRAVSSKEDFVSQEEQEKEEELPPLSASSSSTGKKAKKPRTTSAVTNIITTTAVKKEEQKEEEEEEPPSSSASSRKTKKSKAISTVIDTAATTAIIPSTPAVTTATAPAVIPSIPAVGGGGTGGGAVLLHTLPQLFRAIVVNRPSKTVKSPYLADVKLEGDASEEVFMCHCPCLGLGGLVAPDAIVLISKSKSTTAKSTHVLHHCFQTEEDGSTHHIGTHPQTANVLAQSLLVGRHVFDRPVKAMAKEVTIGQSRFDFVLTHDDDSKTVVEIKNVSIADHCDGSKAKRAKEVQAMGTVDPYAKIALFPIGYRKKAAEPISPRALKHVQELQDIASKRKMRACLMFIIQRTDVTRLRITKTDPIYKDAVKEAKEKGVVMKAYAIRWDGADAYLHRELFLEWEE